MRHPGTAFVVAFAMVSLAACTTNSQVLLPPPGSVPQSLVYWTFASTTGAQIEAAPYPLTNSSTPTLLVNANSGNALKGSATILFDSLGRMWVANASQIPCSISVFSLPLTPSSSAQFVLTLTGCNGLFGMAFDQSGNLWASGNGSGTVQKFTGPFNSTATLTAANTLTVPSAGYPAFDAAGNLYVAKDSSTFAIDVFSAPIGNGASPSFTLGGVTEPFSEVFDASGNLYVGELGKLARYNSNNLGSGATPNIVDSTGQGSGDFAGQLVLDGAGNLYYADCGTSGAKIYVFPTGTQSFSSSLAPTVSFTDATIISSNCVWGINIH